MDRAAAARSTVTALGFVALLWIGPAVTPAATSVTFATTVTVSKTCVVGDATMAFGSYDPVIANLATDLDQTATIVLTCTSGAIGIKLGFGSSSNAPAGCTAPQRCMLSGASDFLNYQLYSDAARTRVWTTAIAETVAGGITTPTSVTIYGRIPAGQDAAVGASYADAITATVNF